MLVEAIDKVILISLLRTAVALGYSKLESDRTNVCVRGIVSYRTQLSFREARTCRCMDCTVAAIVCMDNECGVPGSLRGRDRTECARRRVDLKRRSWVSSLLHPSVRLAMGHGEATLQKFHSLNHHVAQNWLSPAASIGQNEFADVFPCLDRSTIIFSSCVWRFATQQRKRVRTYFPKKLHRSADDFGF